MNKKYSQLVSGIGAVAALGGRTKMTILFNSSLPTTVITDFRFRRKKLATILSSSICILQNFV